MRMNQRHMGMQSTLHHRGFFGSTNKFENHYNIYKNVPRLRHCCYTQTPWVTFSVVAWSRYVLRFTKDFHKVFNAKCQTDIKDFKANSL